MTKDIRLNARIDADLRRKLQELSDTLGINQSAVLTVAINRLHQQEIVPMTAKTYSAYAINDQGAQTHVISDAPSIEAVKRHARANFGKGWTIVIKEWMEGSDGGMVADVVEEYRITR